MPRLEWAPELKFYLALSVNLFPGNRICSFQIGTSACRNWRLFRIFEVTIELLADRNFSQRSPFLRVQLSDRAQAKYIYERVFTNKKQAELRRVLLPCHIWLLVVLNFESSVAFCARDKGAFIFRCFARRERNGTWPCSSEQLLIYLRKNKVMRRQVLQSTLSF